MKWIKNCQQQAEKLNLKNIKFEMQDAENTTFPDNIFDIITEYGALHHLNLDQSF